MRNQILTVAAVLAVLAAGGVALRVWGADEGVGSSCGPSLLTFSTGHRSFDERNCAGRYVRQPPVTLRIGDSLTVRTPSKPPRLPESADPSVLRRTSLSRDGREARFTAVGAGVTTLDLETPACDRTIFSPLPTRSPAADRIPRGICHVLRVVTR